MSWASIISTWIEPWSLSCAISWTMICRATSHSPLLSVLLQLLCTHSTSLTGCVSDTVSGMFVWMHQSSFYRRCSTSQWIKITWKLLLCCFQYDSVGAISAVHTWASGWELKGANLQGWKNVHRLWNRNWCKHELALQLVWVSVKLGTLVCWWAEGKTNAPFNLEDVVCSGQFIIKETQRIWWVRKTVTMFLVSAKQETQANRSPMALFGLWQFIDLLWCCLRGWLSTP